MGIKGTRMNDPQYIDTIIKPINRDNTLHTSLCKRAGKWLKRHHQNIDIPNCPTISIELVTQEQEIADVIGWCSWTSIMIEVKTSRGDFLRDQNKSFRKFPDFGVGEFRYYFCKTGLIKVDELPDKWGLLYLNGLNKVEIIKIAERQESNLRSERNILISMIRRINPK